MADWNIRSNKWPEDTTVTEKRNLSYFWRRNQKKKEKKEEEEKKMPLPFLFRPCPEKKMGLLLPRRMPLCAQSSIRHVTRYYSCSDGQGRRFLESRIGRSEMPAQRRDFEEGAPVSLDPLTPDHRVVAVYFYSEPPLREEEEIRDLWAERGTRHRT
ncbi:hypothetical protein CEXT_102321 [Caerostris extrusa]|uniref:Uncharacterized protein n=1 Tax=Caerostris extrusa TaxID=172846 RepID=A0AAV4N465_CAEEX|nr:hypothetical protein CEXT_102321 [Caerostris extrusa]